MGDQRTWLDREGTGREIMAVNGVFPFPQRRDQSDGGGGLPVRGNDRRETENCWEFIQFWTRCLTPPRPCHFLPHQPDSSQWMSFVPMLVDVVFVYGIQPIATVHVAPVGRPLQTTTPHTSRLSPYAYVTKYLYWQLSMDGLSLKDTHHSQLPSRV